MTDILNNKISIKIFASGKPINVHLLAVTHLSNEMVAKSFNEIIKENEITYTHIKPPRTKGSHLIVNHTTELIEKKMRDIGIEIYIYGFIS